MSENKTPCEELGYSEGDLFEVLKAAGTEFQVGQTVTLREDDRSDMPLFRGEVDGYMAQWFLKLSNVKPVAAKQTVKHICAFGDVFTTIPEGVCLEVSYTKDFATVYFNYVDFPCKTEERLKEVMQAIQTLFKGEEN